MPTPKEFQTQWPLFVLQDLIGHLQANNYLRTAEMVSDAAFVFADEYHSQGKSSDGVMSHPLISQLRRDMN